MSDLYKKHFLKLLDFTPAQFTSLLALAAQLKADKKNGKEVQKLTGKNIALIFEKDSTRTRCSFEVAAFDQGARVTYLGPSGSQIGHKESIKDTARVLGRMYDGIQYRGHGQEVVETLAQYAGVPVWNGLTDEFHPTQVLADFLTIQEEFGYLKGIKLVYVGDGRNNMANSLMIGAAKMGMHFVIASPKSLFPAEELVAECKKIAEECGSGAVIEIMEDPKAAVKGAHAVYTDVWASMGEEDKLAERKKILQPYQVNAELMEATGRDEAIFLHCLPAVKGYEVTEEVFESRRSRVFDEAENRMHTIKAVMVSSIGNL